MVGYNASVLSLDGIKFQLQIPAAICQHVI